MQFGVPVAPRAPTRSLVLLVVAATGMAFCVTLVFLGMRAVMGVGGSCADGGPYVSAQSCPDGSTPALLLGIYGLLGFGGLGFWAGAGVGGAWVGLPLLAWPGLFLSLGFNFLRFGFAPPWGGGFEWGFVVPGILFVAMGAIPLLFARKSRREFEGDDAGPRVAATFGLPATGGQSVKVSYGWHPDNRVVTPARSSASGSLLSMAAAAPVARDDLHGDLVDRLERLAQLRRAGDITNEQFETAKATLLSSPLPRSDT